MLSCRVYNMNSSWHESPKRDNGLQIYSILNLHENPRKLLSKDNKRHFYCHFGLPLPKQVIVFAVGEWNVPDSNVINVEVSLDSENPSKKIGALTKDNRALCWESDWGNVFIEQSLKLEAEDRMAKLVLTMGSSSKEDKENVRSPLNPIQGKKNNTLQTPKSSSTKQTKGKTSKGTFTPQNKTIKLEDFWNVDNCEDSPEFTQGTPVAPPSLNDSRRKRTPRSVTIPSGKRRKALDSLEFSKSSSPVNSPRNRNSISSPNISSPSAPSTPSSPFISNGQGPSGRWGHAMCDIDENKIVLIGGQGAKQLMVKDSLWVVSRNSGEVSWNQPSSSCGTGADRRMGHSVCYDPESKVIFVFGGSKNKRWFSDVHQLDTTTWTWSAIQTVGKAPTRAYHSCNLFRGELWVFGGVYPNPDPQPDGCSNDMFVMSLEAKNWYTPIISSLKPLPRSGHTASLIDDRLVMFGGWDAPTCYNDLFFFDLTLMEYTQPTTTGTPPSPRSWHTALTLPGKRVIIFGGYNGIKTLSDGYIFDIGSLTWTGIKTPDGLCARAGHSAILIHQDDLHEDQVAVFGGGDNLGEFFNDFTCFQIEAC